MKYVINLLINDVDLLITILAFFAGMILFSYGIIYILKAKGRKETHYAWATFWEFLACWVLYIPSEVRGGISEHRILMWIEGILSALIKSFNMLFQNGYERITLDGHSFFSSIYNVLRISTNIAMLLFAGAFILKIIDGPLQNIKLFFLRRHYMFFFSVCNEKTLTIAKSIRKAGDAEGNAPKNTRITIVFIGNISSIDPEFREEINHIEAICIDGSVSGAINRHGKSCSGMELFLFDDEKNNLIELEAVCSKMKGICKPPKIKIYVELSEAPWGLYDGYVKKHELSDKDIVVNFVRMEESFVYNNLLKHSIFEKTNNINKADPIGPYEEINAVLVGGTNPRNIEFFKALLHLSQMPGFFLNLTVIDNQSGRKLLKQLMPEVVDDGSGEGDALYHIKYLECIDYNAVDFENTIRHECPRFTFVFVNAGDDLDNISLALRIKALAYRAGRTDKDFSLLANIYSEEVWDECNDVLCKGIIPVGSLKENYDYNAVTYSDIERISEKIHEARHSSKPWTEYLNDEYNRHSVFARSLSYVYKIRILGENYSLAGRPNKLEWSTKEELETIWNSMSDEEIKWKKYEHMRWNMYTRTLGYRADTSGLLKELIKEDKRLLYEVKRNTGDTRKKIDTEKKENWNKVREIRAAAMVHNALVPFDELPLEDKIKDNLELTCSVVDVLQSL